MMTIAITFTGADYQEVLQQIEAYAWTQTNAGKVIPDESLDNFLKCAVGGDSISVDLPTKTIHNRAKAQGCCVSVKRLDGLAHVIMR